MRKNNIPPPETGLWRFSLRAYRRPGVAQACLRLQDRHGLDVNLLLFAAYAAMAGRGAVDAAGLARAADAVAAWNDLAIRPLRALRRVLKGMVPAARTRSAVLAAELAAERAAQALLARHLPARRARSGAERRADLEAALARVAARATAPLDAAGRRAFTTLRSGCEAEIAQPPRLRRDGPLPSPQRRTRPASRPNMSSTRPTE